MAPCLTTANVAHTLDVEGGAHENYGLVQVGGQDVVCPPHRSDDVLHDMESITVFHPTILIVFTVVNNRVG